MTNPRKKLKFEAMEHRRLMAVTAFDNGGTLVLQGNADDDFVTIEAADGSIALIGGLGTTINGQDSWSPSIQPDSLEIRLGDGNDLINIRDVALEGLYINSLGTSGSKLINIQDASFDSYADIYTSTDNDNIFVNRADFGQFSYYTPGGDENHVQIADVTVENGGLYIMSGLGSDDTVDVSNTDIEDGPLYISMQDGADDISLIGVDVGSHARIYLGTHNGTDRQELLIDDMLVDESLYITASGGHWNTIRIFDSHVGFGETPGDYDLDIDTGSWDDDITIQNTHVDDDLRIDTAGGSDDVSLYNVRSYDLTRINTGANSDDVALDVVMAEDLYLYTEDGGDEVELGRLTIDDYLMVSLGNHGDTLSLRSYARIYFDRANFYGGSGWDDFDGWLWGANFYSFEE